MSNFVYCSIYLLINRNTEHVCSWVGFSAPVYTALPDHRDIFFHIWRHLLIITHFIPCSSKLPHDDAVWLFYTKEYSSLFSRWYKLSEVLWVVISWLDDLWYGFLWVHSFDFRLFVTQELLSCGLLIFTSTVHCLYYRHHGNCNISTKTHYCSNDTDNDDNNI